MNEHIWKNFLKEILWIHKIFIFFPKIEIPTLIFFNGFANVFMWFLLDRQCPIYLKILEVSTLETLSL